MAVAMLFGGLRRRAVIGSPMPDIPASSGYVAAGTSGHQRIGPAAPAFLKVLAVIAMTKARSTVSPIRSSWSSNALDETNWSR